MTQDEIVDGLRTAGYTGTYNDMVVAYLREKSGLTTGAYNDLMVQTYGTSTVNDAEALFLADAVDGFALTVPDPLFANVTFLQNYTSDLTDVKGNISTAFGNAFVTGGALRLDGAGDYISIPSAAGFNLPTENFCIEQIVKFNSVTNSNYTLQKGKFVPANTYTLTTSPSQFQFTYYTTITGFNVLVATGMAPISAGQTYHIAATRNGSTFRLFVDGVQEATAESNETLSTNTDPLIIGAGILVSPFSYVNGDIYATRITKGHARYTANFTPPTFFPEQ